MNFSFVAAFCKRLLAPVRGMVGEIRFKSEVAAIQARQRSRFQILSQLKDEGVSADHFALAVVCQTRMINADRLLAAQALAKAVRAGVKSERFVRIFRALGSEPDFTTFGILPFPQDGSPDSTGASVFGDLSFDTYSCFDSSLSYFDSSR